MSLRVARLLAALLLVTILMPSIARADEAQLWVFVKIVDRKVEGQKVEIQVPIEVLQKLGTVRFWDMKHEKVLGTLEGAVISNNYKNTKINESKKVLTVKDEDADLTVVISGKEPRGGSANVVRAEVLDRTNNQSTEWAWSMANLASAVRSYFTADIFGSQGLMDRIEGIERLETCLEPLANVAPYSVIKIDGGTTRIIVKTE